MGGGHIPDDVKLRIDTGLMVTGRAHAFGRKGIVVLSQLLITYEHEDSLRNLNV